MEDDVRREERAIYVIAIVMLAPAVIVAIASTSLGSGTTLCLVGAVLAAIGFARSMRRSRLPRARVVREAA